MTQILRASATAHTHWCHCSTSASSISVPPPDMPPDGDSPTRQGSLNHAPGLAMRSIEAVIDLYDWAGHARGEYLLVRRGECSGATHIGRRASLVQNVVGRPDNCWGNHAICAYKYDLEWWGFVAWREPMGPDFTIWRPSCGVPLDSGSNRWLFGRVEGCHGLHERRATLSPDNEQSRSKSAPMSDGVRVPCPSVSGLVCRAAKSERNLASKLAPQDPNQLIVPTNEFSLP